MKLLALLNYAVFGVHRNPTTGPSKSCNWHKSTDFGWQFQNTVLILKSYTYIFSRTSTVMLFPFGVTVTKWQTMTGWNITTEVKLLLAVTQTQMNRLNLTSR